MTIKEQAARALDNSLDAATNKRGICTDTARARLAKYLDGKLKIRASTVRLYVRYLNSIA